MTGGPRSAVLVRGAGLLLAVVAAAVVTGAFVGWVRSIDDGLVQAVTRPRIEAPQPGRAPAPAVTAAPAARSSTRIDAGAAGAVLVAVERGAVVVQRVEPAAGWVVERARDGGRLDVRLRNGRAEARVEASVVDGVVVPRVRTRSH